MPGYPADDSEGSFQFFVDGKTEGLTRGRDMLLTLTHHQLQNTKTTGKSLSKHISA